MSNIDQRTGTVTLSTGQPLTCLVCGNDQFEQRRWKLNTTGFTLFKIDWANKGALCSVCRQCGYIHWFRQ